jgi:hypothetical protein
VRLSQKRRKIVYNNVELSVSDAMMRMPVGGKGTVCISRKGISIPVEVTYRYGALTLPPTYAYLAKEAPQTMNVVVVTSEQKVDGKELEWILITSLAINGIEDCVRVAHYYTLRWTIERYHHILKTGLRLEDCQIQTYERLDGAIQLYAVVGWSVLLLYRMGRVHGKEEATDYFDATLIEVLEATSTTPMKRVEDVVAAIGKLGGFAASKKQRMPGEQTLWIGIRLLAAQITAYLAAKHKYGTG